MLHHKGPVLRHGGPELDSQHYVEAPRLRLGAAGIPDPVPCKLCGCELLDSAGGFRPLLQLRRGDALQVYDLRCL